MVNSAKKGNFQNHSLFFVHYLYFREGHRGPDWRPWRARSGPRAVVWGPLPKDINSRSTKLQKNYLQ